MKLLILTLTTDLEHPGLLKFKATLEKFGYPYHIIHQVIPKGTHVFGSQMPEIYKWCKEQKDYTHIIYCDAWDSYVTAPYEELLSKIPASAEFFGSTEKNCFPNPELAKEYPQTNSPWKYVNGGGWFSSIKFFLEMVDDNPINGKNDQLWLAETFLKYQKAAYPVGLDYLCEIFQTTGFESIGDFEYQERRIHNNVTGQTPIVFHGNGRTDMTKVYNLSLHVE